MPIEIEDLLNRRSDLSTFLVHLTKDGSGGSPTAKENLAKILTDGKIEARTPMGWTGTGKDRLPTADLAAMKVVCFTETPLQHIYSLFQNIRGRSVKLSSYGLVFTRDTARSRGANPVWYVDMTPGQTRQWELAKALDELRAEAVKASGGFATHYGSKILPFVEQMGSWSVLSKKEFSWEREWRHLGDFTLDWHDTALVLCPEAEIDECEDLGYFTAVDPSWSLERMIATIVDKRARIEVAYERMKDRLARERRERSG